MTVLCACISVTASEEGFGSSEIEVADDREPPRVLEIEPRASGRAVTVLIG